MIKETERQKYILKNVSQSHTDTKTVGRSASEPVCVVTGRWSSVDANWIAAAASRLGGQLARRAAPALSFSSAQLSSQSERGAFVYIPTRSAQGRGDIHKFVHAHVHVHSACT